MTWSGPFPVERLPTLTEVVELAQTQQPPAREKAVATPVDAGATAAALTYHLLHEWPGMVVANETPTVPHAPATAWEPGILRIVRPGDTLSVCLPDDVARVDGPVACPTTLQPAPAIRGVHFVGQPAWAEALGYDH